MPFDIQKRKQKILADAEATQQAWADRTGRALTESRRRLESLSDALFVGDLNPATRQELSDGAGGELDRLASLRSSSCLAVNVFDPFRPRPSGILQAIGGDPHATAMAFEQRKPTGLRGVDPHLDVLFGATEVVGVESKFLETYDPRGPSNSFRPSYFETPGLWDELPGCDRVAERIAEGGDRYDWLGAAQLLKHALGLSKAHPGAFALVLVWYQVDDPVSELVDEEIGRFARAVGDIFPFWAVTYRQLVRHLKANRTEPVPGYFDFLADRYGLFADKPPSPAPLQVLAKRQGVTARRGLAEAIRTVDSEDVVAGYHSTLASAPDRHARGKSYFVDHDGTGPTDRVGSEQAAAKAIFNSSPELAIGSDRVTIVDYQTPLYAFGNKAGGEIDLFGIDARDRSWIIEVGANNETPAAAFFQALRYSAMVDRNRNPISRKVLAKFGRNLQWPPAIAVAADSAYWERMFSTKPAGNWWPELRRLADSVERSLSVRCVFVDLGSVTHTIESGRARLSDALTAGVVT